VFIILYFQTFWPKWLNFLVISKTFQSRLAYDYELYDQKNCTQHHDHNSVHEEMLHTGELQACDTKQGCQLVFTKKNRPCPPKKTDSPLKTYTHKTCITKHGIDIKTQTHWYNTIPIFTSILFTHNYKQVAMELPHMIMMQFK